MGFGLMSIKYNILILVQIKIKNRIVYMLPLCIYICLRLGRTDRKMEQALSFFLGPSFQEHLSPKQRSKRLFKYD